MQSAKRKIDPILLAFINMLGAASLMGFLYCLVVLLHGTSGLEGTYVALYMMWFALSLLSAYAMRKGDIWGSYALGIATVAITFLDLASGRATIGGATLGGLVIAIVASYILTATRGDEHDDLTVQQM
jgi:hypothetical protein